MTYFKWNNDFDIGVADMNAQHKILIGIMNEIYNLNQKGATKPELASAIGKLDSYTRFHFRDEEKYMESIGYDDLERHRLIHENLLAELEKHSSDFKKHHNGLSEDFFYFLRYWLSTHIQHIDRKYGDVPTQLQIAS